MNKKISLNDIKVEWLNKRALVLISIFSTAAYKQERVVIDLRANNVLEQVSSIAKTSGNAELASLYQRIKHEVRLSLSAIKFDDEETATNATENTSSTKDSMFIDRAYPL